MSFFVSNTKNFSLTKIKLNFRSESSRREAYQLLPIRSRSNNAGFNTLGLTVRPMLRDDGFSDEPSYLDYAVTRYNSFIVDQTLARVDADVTCMLTVTANDTYVFRDL